MSDRITLQHLLIDACTVLQPASPTSRLDAELLLAYTLGWSRARVVAERDFVPSAEQIDTFRHFVDRRADLEPVAYIIGQREFYGLDILVDRRVLVPRPETELLVITTLQRVAERRHQQSDDLIRIVDVGTGSGAIAVALAIHLPHARIYASDISADALEVARQNVLRHQVEQRVTLLQGDLLESLPERVDVIVSNPPYTILAEIDTNVYHHEPHLALDGGPDGLQLYQRLFAQAPYYLQDKGEMLVEIGATQSTVVSRLARAISPSAQTTTYRDLADLDRIVAVRT